MEPVGVHTVYIVCPDSISKIWGVSSRTCGPTSPLVFPLPPLSPSQPAPHAAGPASEVAQTLSACPHRPDPLCSLHSGHSGHFSWRP